MFSKKKTEKSTNIDQAVELGTINYLNLDDVMEILKLH